MEQIPSNRDIVGVKDARYKINFLRTLSISVALVLKSHVAGIQLIEPDVSVTNKIIDI